MEQCTASISRHCRNVSSRIVSKRLPEETFEYTPFTDATRQIRLLQFLPECTDKTIILRQTTWVVDILPEYNAISYTWGDPKDPVPVVVNDGVLFVRQNCAYALWQAWLHYPKAFIWIDSICINQSNHDEKSCQVAMMGAIYSKAKLVLICVGQADNDSDFFMQNARKIHGRRRHPLHVLHNPYDGVRNWMLGRNKYYWTRLQRGHDEFCKRTYWQRVWIVQEVASAKKGVILCGRQWLPLRAFTQLEHSATGLQATRSSRLRPFVNNDSTFSFFEEDQIMLDDAFTFLERRLCSDPKDRLYGALQIIDWSSTTMGRIVPDYNLTVYDLALRVLPDIKFYTTRLLVRAFDMSRSDAWVVQHRQERNVYAKTQPLGPSSDALIAEASSSTDHRPLELSTSFVRLQEQVTRQFPAALEEYPGADLDIQERILNSSILTSMEPQPRKILVGGRAKVLACAATLPGDMLMRFTEGGRDDMLDFYLVVRQRSEFTFDIVGQAVSPRFRSIRIWRSSELRERNVNISLSPEDQLFLFAQDARRPHRGYSDDPLGIDDINATLQRLSTRVTACPQGAVRLLGKKIEWDDEPENDIWTHTAPRSTEISDICPIGTGLKV